MKLVAIGGTLFGLAAGSAAGYFFARKRLEVEYAELAQKEIQDAKVYLSMLYKGDGPGQVLQRRTATKPVGVDDSVHEGPPDEVLRRVAEGLTKQLRYAKPGVVVEEPKVKKNVFDGATEPDEEDSESDDEAIRIISVVEYSEGEPGYTQVSLTYFAGDDVLCDEGDIPVEDVEATVGQSNLERFGYKSRDPKVVYIRNDTLEIDYEVVKHEGSFAEFVHGVVEERPSKNRKMPRE